MLSPRSRFGMFRAFFRSGRLEDPLRDELQLHVAMLAEKNMRLGMASDEAQRQARMAAGGFDQTRETVRDARGIRWLDDPARDLCYARHILWKQKALKFFVIGLLAMWKGSHMYLIVRSIVPSAGLLGSIRSALRAIDPDLGIFDPRTMTEVVCQSMLLRRVIATAMTPFAAAALLVATAGLHGVVSDNVSRRTHEIGIRMALGATRGQVLGIVVSGGPRAHSHCTRSLRP